jgi:hypothetical protein
VSVETVPAVPLSQSERTPSERDVFLKRIAEPKSFDEAGARAIIADAVRAKPFQRIGNHRPSIPPLSGRFRQRFSGAKKLERAVSQLVQTTANNCHPCGMRSCVRSFCTPTFPIGFLQVGHFDIDSVSTLFALNCGGR